MKAQNPLRISSESLNLDDIISDLNDTSTQQSAVKQDKKPTTTKPSATTISKTVTKQAS